MRIYELPIIINKILEDPIRWEKKLDAACYVASLCAVIMPIMNVDPINKTLKKGLSSVARPLSQLTQYIGLYATKYLFTLTLTVST